MVRYTILCGLSHFSTSSIVTSVNNAIPDSIFHFEMPRPPSLRARSYMGISCLCQNRWVSGISSTWKLEQLKWKTPGSPVTAVMIAWISARNWKHWISPPTRTTLHLQQAASLPKLVLLVPHRHTAEEPQWKVAVTLQPAPAVFLTPRTRTTLNCKGEEIYCMWLLLFAWSISGEALNGHL